MCIAFITETFRSEKNCVNNECHFISVQSHRNWLSKLFILLRGGKGGGLTSKVLTLGKGVGGSVNILTAVRH